MSCLYPATHPGPQPPEKPAPAEPWRAPLSLFSARSSDGRRARRDVQGCGGVTRRVHRRSAARFENCLQIVADQVCPRETKGWRIGCCLWVRPQKIFAGAAGRWSSGLTDPANVAGWFRLLVRGVRGVDSVCGARSATNMCITTGSFTSPSRHRKQACERRAAAGLCRPG